MARRITCVSFPVHSAGVLGPDHNRIASVRFRETLNLASNVGTWLRKRPIDPCRNATCRPAPLMCEFVWTRPEFVAQIRFAEWTAEGWLRHAAFLGLRSDKVASAVHLEL